MRRLWREIFRREEGRLMLIGLVMVASLFLLATQLFQIQVVRSAQFGASQERQSQRLVEIPAVRGLIYDRNGICLADSRPSFDAVIYLEELSDEWHERVRQEIRRHGKRLEPGRRDQILVELVREKANTFGRLIGQKPQFDDRAIRVHAAELRPLPLILFPDLNEGAVAIANEHSPLPTGMAIEVNAVRRYGFKAGDQTYPLAAHSLGYVTRSKPTLELDQSLPTFTQAEVRGVSGLEMKFDRELRGRTGSRTILINARGYKERELGVQPPQPGHDLVLSLDARCQQAAEQALGEHIGAAVVMDPNNGDVLALASNPTFDPNKFIPRIHPQEMDALLKDPSKPLANRAVSEQYAPGSTFKLVVALAGLDSGKLAPGSAAFCSGEVKVAGQLKKCWIKSKGGQHGAVNLRSSIVHSCNIFFYEHGMDIGMGAIVAMAKQLHLGERTGIPLPREARGHLPDMMRRHRPAETANIAIGQGEVDATPLQMACVTAAIANGGTVIAPRLVKSIHQQNRDGGIGTAVEEFPPRELGRLTVRPQLMELVRQAMRGVVQDADGTGKKAGIPGVEIAGKTGTAQVMDAQANITGHRAWFVSFAPYQNPKYALAIMLEDGDSGGQVAAPVAGKIYAHLFGVSPTKETAAAKRPQRPLALVRGGRH
ncbi:MAG: penicillin-binding protein 2 [Verrucomicrobia bacterium]|nr:penicillin-binding protein 2 [Verrucomicrobiota bacterium]